MEHKDSFGEVVDDTLGWFWVISGMFCSTAIMLAVMSAAAR